MPGIRLITAMGAASVLLLTALSLPAEAAQLNATHPPRITVEEVKQMLDQGEEVLLIDVRTKGQWASSGHKAKGAIRIDNASDLLEMGKTYSTDTPIVTYCT